MTSYWIADLTGRHALVEGEDALSLWTRVRAWRTAAEPTGQTQTYVTHRDGFIGCIPFEALAVGWAEQGWAPGPPPEPIDVTRDPAPEAEPAPAPVKPKTPSAGGGKNEEK